MVNIVRHWRQLPTSDKYKTIASLVLCTWALGLSVDMYMMRQRPDFQRRFGLEGEEEPAAAEPEEKPWRKAAREREQQLEQQRQLEQQQRQQRQGKPWPWQRRPDEA